MGYSIDKSYHDLLGINDYGEYSVLPSQLCLCTVLDMGRMGEFDADCIDGVMNYAKDRGYQMLSDIYGIIVGRGNTNGEYSRVLLICMPVKNL